MPISPEKQKELANEQPGKNDVTELQEKEARQKQSELQVSASLGQIEPNVRDAAGNLVLFEDTDGSNIQGSSQHITVKTKTPVHDSGEVDSLLDNVVEELLPMSEEEDEGISLSERIRNFFIEYEELRDLIWDENEMEAQESHVYLVKQSKSYLPIPKVPLRYDGDVAGMQGEGRLKSNNVVELRDAVFLPSMEGHQIDLYGLSKNENPVLTINDIIKTIITKMATLELGEIDVNKFTATLKRSLSAKYETGQIRKKEQDDLDKKLEEVLKELYPNLEQGDTQEKKEEKMKEDLDKKPKKTTSDKASEKRKRRLKGFRARRKKGARYTNARMRVRNRKGKTTNSNRQTSKRRGN